MFSFILQFEPVSAGLPRQQVILDERQCLFQSYSRPNSSRRRWSNDQPTNQLNQDSSLKFEQSISEKGNLDTPVLPILHQNKKIWFVLSRSGLGIKQISLPSHAGGREVAEIIYSTFPKLKEAGGFSLLVVKQRIRSNNNFSHSLKRTELISTRHWGFVSCLLWRKRSVTCLLKLKEAGGFSLLVVKQRIHSRLVVVSVDPMPCNQLRYMTTGRIYVRPLQADIPGMP